MPDNRKLCVFPSTGSGQRLCHSSQDKPIVRELYQRLNAVPQGDDKGWIDSWLDGEKLLPDKN